MSLKHEPASEQVYLPGGWFATGDIGEWTTDGCIKIVDRKKNLVKLKGGEYVALEYLEIKFNNSDFVDAIGGGIMVYYLISQKVFTKSFCKSQFPHKSVNVSFIITNFDNTLTDLCGS